MVKLWWISLIATSVLVPWCKAAKSGQRTVYLSEITPCAGKENLSLMLHNFTLETRNRTQNYLSGDIEFLESFPTGLRSELLKNNFVFQ